MASSPETMLLCLRFPWYSIHNNSAKIPERKLSSYPAIRRRRMYYNYNTSNHSKCNLPITQLMQGTWVFAKSVSSSTILNTSLLRSWNCVAIPTAATRSSKLIGRSALQKKCVISGISGGSRIFLKVNSYLIYNSIVYVIHKEP